MSQVQVSSKITTSYNAQPHALVKTKEGMYLIAGRAFNGKQPDTGFAMLWNGGPNIPRWQKSYGAEYSTMFEDATQLKDGNFIAVGIWFTSSMSGDENIWIMKIDAQTGDMIWQKNIGEAGIKSDGYSVAATADGGFVVSALMLGNNIYGTKIIKFDHEGNQVWETCLDNGVAYSIINTKDGGYALTGSSTESNNVNSYVYAAKLNTKGELLWENVYKQHEVYVMLSAYSDICENSDGTFVICAKSVLMKIKQDGNPIWSHQKDNLNLGSVIELKDGGFAVAGGLIGADYHTRAYVAGLESDGKTICWDNTEMGYNSDIAQIALTDYNEVIGVGDVEGVLYGNVFMNSKDLFDK